MAGVYDFDKTILAAYNQGANRGVEMVNMAEKRNQFAALQKLREDSFKLQEGAYDRGIQASEDFAKHYKAKQDAEIRLEEYNKAIEKERSYVQGLNLFDTDFWTFDTFRTQMGISPIEPEESYKKRMAREGTAELGIPPEPYYPELTPEMAGLPQFLQLIRQGSVVGAGDRSIEDLMMQIYDRQ